MALIRFIDLFTFSHGGHRCHKILGPPWIWGPPGPISLGYWGPLRESGAPFGAKSMRTAYGSTVRYVSAAVNKTKRTNFPTHFGGVKYIMMEKEETEKEGRFNYSEIYAYMKEGTCIDVH